MVIGKGTAYGTESAIDPSWPSFDSDAALAEHITTNGTAPCTVTAGDILTTLGGGAPSGVASLAYPIDLIEVIADGETFTAVAHVVARRRLWTGQFLVAMNAAWVDGLYLGPRSHPNDGLVDVTFGSLAWQQRFMARRRAVTGTHLPHPAMKMVRRSEYTAELDRSLPLRLDGVAKGTVRNLRIQVRPDAGVVVV